MTRLANERRLAVGSGAAMALCLMLTERAAVKPAQPNQRKPVPSASRSLSTAEIFRRQSGAVVLINTFDVAGAPLKLGSGVVLAARGIIATNAHVIAGAASAQVVVNGVTYEALSVLKRDDLTDVAVLMVGNSDAASSRLTVPINLPVVTLAKQLPQIGSRVVAIGNPQGFELSVSEGIVSSYRDSGDQVLIQHTAPISPGSSGGALFDERGDLIGLTSASITSGQNLNFAVSTQSLKEAVQRFLADGHPVPFYASTLEGEIAQFLHTAHEGERTGTPVRDRMKSQMTALATRVIGVDASTAIGLISHALERYSWGDYRQSIAMLSAALKSPDAFDSRWERTARMILAVSLREAEPPDDAAHRQARLEIQMQLKEAVETFLRTTPPSLLLPEDDAEDVRWALQIRSALAGLPMPNHTGTDKTEAWMLFATSRVARRELGSAVSLVIRNCDACRVYLTENTIYPLGSTKPDGTKATNELERRYAHSRTLVGNAPGPFTVSPNLLATIRVEDATGFGESLYNLLLNGMAYEFSVRRQ